MPHVNKRLEQSELGRVLVSGDFSFPVSTPLAAVCRPTCPESSGQKDEVVLCLEWLPCGSDD